MAHWIGRVASEAFGFELIGIEASDDTTGPRMYGDPTIPITIPAAGVETIATPDDLLICNPSFSGLGLGRAFPGRSICYVQGLDTFPLLDKFTHYVSVSSAVAGYLSLIYGIQTRVIPPFLTIPSELSRQRWADKASSILMLVKQGGPLHQMVLKDTIDSIESACPDLPVIITEGYALTQREFLRRLSEHKFVLAFSPQEGFGLTPLEAMACGAVVLGLNGVGGRDYMRPGDNCLAVEWVDHERIAALTAQAFNDPALCERISHAAMQTASEFTLKRFQASWRTEIGKVLA